MSTAEVRRRYKRELAAAQQLFDPPALPLAIERWRDQYCDRCGIGTGRVWHDDGERYRRCVKCEEGREAVD